MKHGRKRVIGGVIALAACLVAFGTAGHGQEKSAPARPGVATIGKVNIAFGTARVRNKPRRTSDGEVELINGLNGAANAEIRSTLYDLAAPKITLRIRAQVLDTASATGGARVVTRERDAATGKLRPAIDLRSDTANYVGERKATANAPARPARLELRGNVKGTYLSTLFSDSDPLQVDTDAADIEFPDGETAVLVLRNGQITGTPVEPPKTEKDAGKKPRR